MASSPPPTPLRELRVARGLGLRETARRAEMNPGTLSMIERGRLYPSVGELEAIQEALSLPRPLEMVTLPVMR